MYEWGGTELSQWYNSLSAAGKGIFDTYYGNYKEYSGLISNLAPTATELLLNTSPTVNTIYTLADSIKNYAFLLCQGVYNGSTTSNYNTTLIYMADDPTLIDNQRELWCVMKDRNSNYRCYFTLIDDTHIKVTAKGNLGGVMIYGIK